MMVSYESAPREVSFEWSEGISFTDPNAGTNMYLVHHVTGP